MCVEDVSNGRETDAIDSGLSSSSNRR